MEAARSSQPFSIRLPRELDDLVAAEARRTNRSRSAVVRSLAEEGLRARMFPRISFAGPEGMRRATVASTGWDVWQVVAAMRDFGSVEGLTEAFDLTERDVQAALSYAERFPEEIEQEIADNERPIEELRRDYPFADVVTVD